MSLTRLRPSQWTLRRRILLAVLALLAVVLTLTVVLSTASVERVLTDRLDRQLAAAAERAQRAADNPPPPQNGDGGPGDSGQPGDGPGPVPDFLEIPGQPEDTLGATIVDGQVQRTAVLDHTGTGQAISAAAAAPLLHVSVDGAPTTVDLGSTLGEYRVLAVTGADGQVIVTGLSLTESQDTVARLAATIAGIAGVGLVLAAAAGALILRVTLRPLDRVAATATRVAEVPLHRGEVVLPDRVPEADTDQGTEVGQVGFALNRLLGHVTAALNAREASEQQVRQFVADASHELRTPLASIRGYAELTRRVPEPLPPDVTYALQRVESEATRMTGLVEDLLLLARLDAEPSVQQDPVDLTGLVLDAVSDARAAGAGHRWRLDLPAEPITVTGDRDRLHQVVSNLLSNARAHTPAGTTVTTALRHTDAGAGPRTRLTVTDDGPGIPPELQAHVFERFRRADTSRSRAAGSSGLGLAIVAAVVAAHGGDVGVISEPGRTEFAVDLPEPTER